MNWPEILAVFVNSVLVLIAVQALKNYVMPFLKTRHPWTLPIIAMIAGPIFEPLSTFLTGLIGYPIDLSAIVAVLTGAASVAIYGVLRKAGRTRGGKILIFRKAA